MHRSFEAESLTENASIEHQKYLPWSEEGRSSRPGQGTNGEHESGAEEVKGDWLKHNYRFEGKIEC